MLLALVGGIAGTTVGLIQADDQRRVAEKSAAAERQAKLEAERAAAAEKRAKVEAERRLAQIEKGVELFAGLVSGLNPRAEEQGAPPLYEQLRERASKAADALVGEAVGDPDAVARLQTLLARSLRELGDYAKAVEVLERARATREAKLGADHIDTLDTLNELVMAYQFAGKLPEAIALSEQVRDTFVKKSGADHPDTLTAMDNVARVYHASGKRSQAIALFEKVRDYKVKKLGVDHNSTLMTLNNLAVAYHQDKRLPEAIALYQQVRDANVKELGADHNSTLSTVNNLACAHLDAGNRSEAIALHKQIRDVRVKKLGEAHPDTLTTLNNLAFAYQTDGKLPEAIAQYQQIRDAITKKLEADHPLTLVTLNNLALSYKADGKLPEAVPLFQLAAAGMEKLRFEHQYAGRIIDNTIDAYEQSEQYGKAEFWRRKWLPVLKKKAGADSPTYIDEFSGLGMNLLAQKKWAEAETSLKECLTLREKIQPDSWYTFDTKSMLGGALLEQKKFTEAEPLLLAGYDGLKKGQSQIPQVVKGWVFSDALERLVKLHDVTDRPTEAAKWRKELESHRKAAEPMKK